MNIIIVARGQPKKFKLPDRSQNEPEDEDMPRKSGCGEKLTNGQQIHATHKRQRGHEVQSTPIAKVACADC
jgi:hypothetical protein